MRGSTVPGRLDGEYRGKTTPGGFAVLKGGASWERCRSCGSVLYPSRLESRKLRLIGGERLLVEMYRCRCNTGREIRRPMEAAAA